MPFYCVGCMHRTHRSSHSLWQVEAFSVKHTYKGVWGKDASLTSVPLSPELPPQPISGAGEHQTPHTVHCHAVHLPLGGTADRVRRVW